MYSNKQITLEFAELHTPLFLGGKNHGLKLVSAKPGDVILVYNRQDKELYVTHNGKTSIIPSSNVVSMTPAATEPPPANLPLEAVQTEKTGQHKKVISAQVSTPTSHVFGEPTVK